MRTHAPRHAPKRGLTAVAVTAASALTVVVSTPSAQAAALGGNFGGTADLLSGCRGRRRDNGNTILDAAICDECYHVGVGMSR